MDKKARVRSDFGTKIKLNRPIRFGNRKFRRILSAVTTPFPVEIKGQSKQNQRNSGKRLDRPVSQRSQFQCSSANQKQYRDYWISQGFIRTIQVWSFPPKNKYGRGGHGIKNPAPENHEIKEVVVFS